AQLPQGGGHRRGVLGVHYTARDFQLDGVGTVSILLDEHQLLIGRAGDDIDPVDTIEHKEIVLAARARRNLPVAAQSEHAEIAKRLRTKLGPRLNHGPVTSSLYRIRRDDLDAFDGHAFIGTILWVGGGSGDLFQDIVAFDQLTEGSVLM